MTRDRIRPRPCAGSLAEQVRALACRDKGADQRPLGATSNDELSAWCDDLADKIATYGDLEAAHARIAELEAGPKVGHVELSVLDVEPMSTFLAQLRDAIDWSVPPESLDEIVEAVREQRAETVAIRGALEPKFFDGMGAVWGATTEEIVGFLRGVLAERDAANARIAELAGEVEDSMRSRVAAEAQLVDMLSLELEVVGAYRRAGALPADEPPPPTAELVALMKAGRS